jgi:hypothetical protein
MALQEVQRGGSSFLRKLWMIEIQLPEKYKENFDKRRRFVGNLVAAKD